MVKPHLAFTHTRELLGKKYSKEALDAYGPHYFPYEIEEDVERSAIRVKEGDRHLSPEALVAMVLTYAKSLGQAHTGEKVADCVITVPGFYRQFERQAVLDAAAIAGLNVLALMNDHTAVALKYGIDHNVASLTEPRNVVFYDMGSTATRVSVVQFSAIPDKEAFQKNKTLGQLKVLSTAWDESLGGYAFTSKVAEILKGKSKIDPSKNSRAMAKLIQAAEKTKVILSANKDAHPTIESFIDDYDFRASIMRADFEDASRHLLERVEGPILEAMKRANFTKDDIHSVGVIGGGWRIPMVQDKILSSTGKPQLDKTLNADEAFCFGAALYAASLSTAFRLRKFGVHDITSFPVSIDIDSLSGGVDEVAETEGEEEKAEGSESSPGKKNVKLFKAGHRIPSKRLLTFKRDEDLTFTLKYDDEVPAHTPVVIARYNITGVKKAMEKFPNATGKPKINVSFRLTRSGLVEVDKAEVAIEEMVEVETCETVKPPAKNETQANETAGEAKEAGENNQTATGNQTEEEAEKRVCTVKEEKRVRRVALVVAAETPVPRPFTSTQVKETKKVLEDYDERERKIRERASAFNALESYIYTTKEKLESNVEMREVTTETFRKDFTAQLDKMSSWLDEDGWEADTLLLRSKLAELTQVGDPVFFRMKQAIERPVAIEKANKMLVAIEESVKNLTKKMSWLNESHTQMVTNKTEALKEWMKTKMEEQEKQPAHEDPVFTSDEVFARFPAIEEALKRLARVQKPLPPKKPKAEKKENETKVNATEETEGEKGEESKGEEEETKTEL
uniref:Uncharacterized protein n=1 Tax=Guillardia theta TaxID=55529 RepID=A0A6U6CFQ6_GUITH